MAAVANLAESRMKLVFVDEAGDAPRKRSVTYSGLAEDAGNEALLKIAGAVAPLSDLELRETLKVEEYVLVEE